MDRIQDVTEQAVADAKARFDALAREASHRAERDRELAAKVQAITATAASRRDEVNVTVNHAGQVTDVTISEKGMELSAQDLSRLVVRRRRHRRKGCGCPQGCCRPTTLGHRKLSRQDYWERADAVEHWR